ncbi:epidermal growth factor-like protein 7 [Seriola lalandi dorsalis]|uniref:EGF-like-domain, multiple 7 n=1 Tax=Seriola lalandi dorsalis TaxID=1841481 RepID=A0A3B4Y857_SERLL|nr:epidermal growth factor-like protein 7 [Seriola lalandi dorsalis]XP_023278079.1 epidermal growth factor-like protein 7 [Seriola lalandi dorsalis]XP_056259162.1 epidermal growth factor-like protein 7 [Seriola aureovittata]XP_056259163.1 epidermal growth factor-like protein 7 [Seriola aureovittata]XP_056259164.1 epidermal growth factor-like protein 7 [Seriola aureovittata]
MYQTLLLSSSLFILHVMGTPQFFAHHGRRVCGRDLRHNVVTATESYVQPVHKPYITLCQGHRLCSTYKTVYSVAYRQVSRVASPSRFYPECCPGWRRFHSHNCNQAVCGQACVNGGTCLRPNQCACPIGWTGHQCQTDVDECSEQRPCAQGCVNTAGSYRCACRGGFRLAGDGRSCQSLPPPPPPPLRTTSPTPTQPSQATVGGHPDTGGSFSLAENVTEEVQSLRNRVELLEKKLQLVLTPFTSFFPLSLDEGLSEKTTLLSHSFQQLDRIDSLSEQIGFLEERLGTCSCQEN